MSFPNPESVTITLTQQQLNIISNAFALAPYGQVAPLINEINKQIQDQLRSIEKVIE